MGFKKIAFLSLFIISIIAVNFIFAEEIPVTEVSSGAVTSNQEPVGAQEKNDTQWAWGEVISLDNQAKTFTIRYLDYELDQEKDLFLAIDDKTTFENIEGIDELKLKDTLSIDYAVGPDNNNIAKNISLEKPDALIPATAQTKEEDKSVSPQSTAQQEAPVEVQATTNEVSEPVTAPVTESAVLTESAPGSTAEVSDQAQ